VPPPAPPPRPQIKPKWSHGIDDLSAFARQEFHAANDSMVFVQAGKAARSELRFRAEWSTASAARRRLFGLVHLPPPGPTAEQFTWLQIHGGKAAGVPLLRLYWLRDGRRGHTRVRDALLAVVRLNVGEGTWRAFGGWLSETGERGRGRAAARGGWVALT